METTETIEEVPLIGGLLALDLVNTAQRGVTLPGESNHDYLQSPGDLVTWAIRVGLVGPDEARRAAAVFQERPAEGERALRAVREIRESLYRVLLAVVDESATDDAVRRSLDVLQQWWIRALKRSALDVTDPNLDRRLRVGTEPAHLLVDRIAVAAVDAVRCVDTERLRQCPVESGGCGWLFVDRSRNGSRRWCRMADCGTQVKSRRLTERRRVTGETSARRPKAVH